MVDSRVIEYIQFHRAKGKSDDQILQDMINAGYSEEVSKQALGATKPMTKRAPPKENMFVSEPVPSNFISRSFYLTKICFHVMMKDQELLAYAVLSSIFSVLLMIALAVPYIVSWIALEAGAGLIEVFGAVALFVIIIGFYFGLSFIAIFFNAASVYTVKTRIEGGNPTFGDGIGFAIKRLPRIIQWALITTTVGLLLILMERSFRRLGPIGAIIGSILVAILGIAWSIITLFVIPSMVIDNIGPWSAMKRSVNTLKKVWGESFTFAIGMGLAHGVFALPAIIGIAAAIFIAFSGLLIFAIVLAGIAAIYLVILSMIFKILGQTFRTAVYMYASTGVAAPEFGEELLRGAFKEKKKKRFGMF